MTYDSSINARKKIARVRKFEIFLFFREYSNDEFVIWYSENQKKA